MTKPTHITSKDCHVVQDLVILDMISICSIDQCHK